MVSDKNSSVSNYIYNKWIVYSSSVLKASFYYLEYYNTYDMSIFQKSNEKKEIWAKNILINHSAEVDESACVFLQNWNL